MASEKEFHSSDFSDSDLVSASTETIGGNPSQKSLWSQAELTRRLMGSIRDLDKSTARYSSAVIILTFVLALIAFLQLTATIFPLPDDVILRSIVFALCIFLVAYTFWRGVKEFSSNRE